MKEKRHIIVQLYDYGETETFRGELTFEEFDEKFMYDFGEGEVDGIWEDGGFEFSDGGTIVAIGRTKEEAAVHFVDALMIAEDGGPTSDS